LLFSRAFVSVVHHGAHTDVTELQNRRPEPRTPVRVSRSVKREVSHLVLSLFHRGPALMNPGEPEQLSHALHVKETSSSLLLVPSSSWLETHHQAFDGNLSLALSASDASLDFHINPWHVMLLLSGTVIALENALVVAIIIYTPSLRNPMFILIASLATADLLAGMGLILNFVFQYLVSSQTISLITVGFLVSSFTASISSLLAITVDRYLSLYNALTYFSEKTLHYVHLMLVGTWGVSLCLGLLPVLGWNCLDDASSCSIVSPLRRSNLKLLASSFFIIFFLMLSLYFKICQIVSRHAHQIALQQHFFSPSQFVATRKGVWTLAIILGVFGASWLPFALYCLLGVREDPAVYTYATLLPATYNSMLNPIIYGYRNSQIQRSLQMLFCGCLPNRTGYRSRSPSEV
ncbi:hypothetical protein DNTS_004236, partial [Danionella cerebrum]